MYCSSIFLWYADTIFSVFFLCANNSCQHAVYTERIYDLPSWSEPSGQSSRWWCFHHFWKAFQVFNPPDFEPCLVSWWILASQTLVGTPCFSSWLCTQVPPMVFSHSSASASILGVSGLVNSDSVGTVCAAEVLGTLSKPTMVMN